MTLRQDAIDAGIARALHFSKLFADQEVEVEQIAKWAVEGALNHVVEARREYSVPVVYKEWTQPTEPLDQTAVGAPYKVPEREAKAKSMASGYNGHACPTCGNFTLRQSGTCMACDTCGSTTGCS